MPANANLSIFRKVDKSQCKPMHQISATEAKQTFGHLLEEAARGPVAIEKHGKVKAIVASPEFFSAASTQQAALAERKMVRLAQAMREQERLIKHQQVALTLATLPPAKGKALVSKAKAVVAKWQANDLCSRDYIERWQKLLSLPLPELAKATVSDLDGWGTALRQNSPWAGIAP